MHGSYAPQDVTHEETCSHVKKLAIVFPKLSSQSKDLHQPTKVVKGIEDPDGILEEHGAVCSFGCKAAVSRHKVQYVSTLIG
jgi:hypothetical protein